MKHIPNKIYLNIGCDPKEVKDFSDLSEVTWCADKVGDGDIEYTRKPVWHDLRKNPNDLPNNDRIVLIHSKYHITTSCYSSSKWLYEGRYNENVLAWMEIPEFK
jgi:hypothetical protein